MFVRRHLFNSRTNILHTFRADFLERNLADKTIQAHTAISFRISVRRQGMIRSRSIISRTFRRERSQENGARIHHTFCHLHIVRSFHNQMFGCIFVRQFDGLFHIFHHNKLTVGKRFLRNFLTGQKFQLTFHFLFHSLLQNLRSSNQHCLTIHTVFSLAQQIRSYKYRICRFIRQYFHFRRTGRHINRHITQTDQLFRCRHILVSRTEYLVNLRHAFRSVSHRSNSLHAACLEYPAHPCHLCSKKNSRMHPSFFIRWCAKHNLLTTRNLCRHSQHQHSREQRSCSSGNIQSHLFNSHRLLPARHARHGFHLLALKALCSMESLYILFSQTDSRLQLFIHQRLRFFQFRLRHRQ